MPAALALPYGHLFFGYDVQRLRVPAGNEPNSDAPPEPQPEQQAFRGSGHMLQSRPSPEVIEIDSD